jgi:ATP-binding cassette subfamily B (MDR/TAP) protein 1
MSYPFSSNSPTLTCFSQGGNEKENWSQFKDPLYRSYYGHDTDGHKFDEELEESDVMSDAGRVAVNLRKMVAKSRKRISQSVAIQVSKHTDEVVDKKYLEEGPPKLFSTIIKGYPSIPAKPLLVLGLLFCLASGAMTPLFSFLLSSLLYQVSIGAKNTTTLNIYGGIVLGVAALDGLLLGLKHFVMEQVGMMWTTKLRKLALEKVIGQDKSWFDLAGSSSIPSVSSSSSSSPPPSSPTPNPTERKNDIPQLIQIIVKDGDEARNLISIVLAQTVVVVTMLSVGIIWAFSRGWELTLMGLAILPVFATAMAVQTHLVSKCERRNKSAREEISKVWYESLKNVKGIRYMGIEGVFREKFDRAVDVAEERGIRGGWVEGVSYGVASALIYVAEAALFYVGAVLIANGRYTYLKMVEVLNLVVFTVTIGSQLMAFSEFIPFTFLVRETDVNFFL